MITFRGFFYQHSGRTRKREKRERGREIAAVTRVCNNLHLICFFSPLPPLPLFFPAIPFLAEWKWEQTQIIPLLGNTGHVEAPNTGIQVLFGFGYCLLLHIHFLMVHFPFWSFFFSPLLLNPFCFPISFPSFLPLWLHSRDFCAWQMNSDSSQRELQQPWAFIKAVLRNDHSAVGKLSWPWGQSC